MSFDVVITTLNRPDSLLKLLNQIDLCVLKPNKIFVVNSGFVIDKLNCFDNVIQVLTNHKNQPYQRKLGVFLSKATYVVFFDDDLIIHDFNIFNYLLSGIQVPGVVMTGVLMGIASEENNKPILIDYSKISYSLIIPSFSFFIKPGKSVFGSDPYKMNEATTVDCLTGGNGITCKRDVAFEIIDWLIIMLAEKGMGQGEDKYISMRASSYGLLSFNNKLSILHPSNTSNYIATRKNIFRKNLEFGRKKLLLSLTANQLFNNKLLKIFFFIWIIFWHGLIEIFIVLFTFNFIKIIKKYFEVFIKIISIVYAFNNIIFISKKSRNKWVSIIDNWLLLDKNENEFG